MITAIILARKGSKRLPGKNTRDLGGRPLVAWAIVEGLKSAYIDKIIVSSDDDEVLAIANDYSVYPVRRPSYLATDEASPYDEIRRLVRNYIAEWHVVLLQPTSPLRVAADIDLCIKTCLEMTLQTCAASAPGATVPNGAVYVATSEWLDHGGNWDDDGVKLVPMPAERSVDINTIEDFEWVEAIL